MKLNSVLNPKNIAWGSASVVVLAILLIFVTHTGAKPAAPPPPTIEVASVEQKDVPLYQEWIGTLTGQVNADVKAQVQGYLLAHQYEGLIKRSKLRGRRR